MLEFTLTPDVVQLDRLDELEGDARFAAAIALTKTAKLAQGDVKEAMIQAFDRPTRYTLNSTFTKPARKADLVARVGFRDWAGKGTTPSKFVFPQVYGGARNPKRFERALQARGAMPRGLFVAPGAHADLDSHGNMSKGQIVKVLSSLRAFGEQGYTANQNTRGRSRGKRRNEKYFAVPTHQGGLGPGVYKRDGRDAVRVMTYIEAPSYTPRLRFVETVEERVTRSFADVFDATLESVIMRRPW